MAKAKPPAQRTGAIRCAVYTRKSTDEGLEQSFNSLDAQREACEAYILSQRHEGWTLVRDAYDDGGFSGGNMDRPGLQRLLEDVGAGRVDVIVVYKVDRLTRSLADFAKIVEILDERNASFVSVTQAFNTTSSMGRLTLNVLLSFAQFEREVTGERIRDKIAASKAKGMWMGGNIPLGYDVKDRKLVVNEAEAEQVRTIFQRYAALGSARLLIAELNERGYRTKRNGIRGGNTFGRGPLYHILKNRIYLGEIAHQGKVYPGEHQAIIDQHLWDAVQQMMSTQRIDRRRGNSYHHHSFLVGRLVDGEGRRMSPSHAAKGGKRYRYYVTRDDARFDGGPPPWRVPADDLECAVVQLTRSMLTDRMRVMSIIQSTNADVLSTALTRAGRLAERLDDPAEKRLVIDELDPSIRIGEEDIEVRLSALGVAKLFDPAFEAREQDDEIITLRAPAIKARRGNETKLIIANDNGRTEQNRDRGLINLIAEARAIYQLLLDNAEIPIARLVREQGKCKKRVYKLLRVAMLAPDIVLACVEGKQPVGLTVTSLLDSEIPMRWQDQRELLGFA